MFATAVTKSPLRAVQNKYHNLLQRLSPSLRLSKFTNSLAVGGHVPGELYHPESA